MDPKVIIKNPTFDSSDNNPDLITVKNVDFFYKGNKQALFNISMKLKNILLLLLLVHRDRENQHCCAYLIEWMMLNQSQFLKAKF